MKLSCSSQIAPGETFLEKFAYVKKAGFDGMELRILGDGDLDAKAKEVKSASIETGVLPSSLLVPSPAFRRPLIDKEALQAKIEHMKVATAASGAIGCPTLLCPEYGYQDPLPLFTSPKRFSDYEKGLFMELISEADRLAEANGGSVLIEPINRYETHYNLKLSHAKELIEATGAKRVKILADFFHMNIEEDNTQAAILEAGALIGHVHVADNNRLLPGRGQTDFVAGFKALFDVGYDGFLALECIIPEDLDAELARCVAFLRGCLLKAKAQ